MKPLFVLLGAFLLALLTIKLVQGTFGFHLAGRISMAIMLLFTAMGHFKLTSGMAGMIPEFFPFRNTIVILSGLLEILLAIMILIPRFQVAGGWLLLAFLLMALPFNIFAALHHIDYQQAGNRGPGPAYLWFRIPLQIFFLLWVYVSCIARAGQG